MAAHRRIERDADAGRPAADDREVPGGGAVDQLIEGCGAVHSGITSLEVGWYNSSSTPTI